MRTMQQTFAGQRLSPVPGAGACRGSLRRLPLVRAQASPAATPDGLAIPTPLGTKATKPANNRVDKNLVRIMPKDGPPSTLPLPPGPPFLLPFFGETNAYLSEGNLRFGLNRYARYGPVFRTSFFGFDLYMVCHPEYFRACMAEDSSLLRFEMGGAFVKLIGDFNIGVLTNRNNSRMPFRRSLLGSVTNEALAGYVPKMAEISAAAVDELLAQPEGWDITVEARKWGMAFANALLAGIQTAGPEEDKVLREDLALYFEGLITYDIDLPGTPLRKAINARERLLRRIRTAVAKQVDEILADAPVEMGQKVRRNMMGYVVDYKRGEGMKVDVDGLAEMALGVLQAGTDTSSGGLAGLFAVLAQRPDLWAQLRAEQEAVIAQHGHEVSKASLDASKLLDACVREALRFTPPGASQYRMVLEEFELDGKYRIPKGSWLIFNVLAAQAMEADPGWPERATAAAAAGEPVPIPECSDVRKVAAGFNPERWLGDPTARPTLFTFGQGPHTCLGMGLFIQEAKVLLSYIIRRADLELLTKDFSWVEMPMVKPEAGVMMRLKPLDNPV